LSLCKLITGIKLSSFFYPYHDGEQQFRCFTKQKYKYYEVMKQTNSDTHITSWRNQQYK